MNRSIHIKAVPIDIIEKFKAIAEEQDRSMSYVMRKALEAYVTQDKPQKVLSASSKPTPDGQVQNSEAYGNKDINNMLTVLKLKIGIECFADAQKWARIYAKHCFNLMNKIGPEEFSRRLDVILEDKFKHNNCNKIKYVYEQVKGFIEPKQITNNF